MALEMGGGVVGMGGALLLGGGIVYEIIAANCSSPQTAELNANKRAATLMKWVHMGAVQSVIFLGAAMLVDKQHRWAIAIGGGMALGIMYGLYSHAKISGLASAEPATEQW